VLTSDASHCIYRVPLPPVAPNTSHLAAKHPLHVPVYLRSTKLPLPKPNAAIRITELLTELGVNTQKLVMPTRNNIEIFERLLVAAGGLVDMKRQVDRVEQEMRTLRAQREGFVAPMEGRKVSPRHTSRDRDLMSLDSIRIDHFDRHVHNEQAESSIVIKLMHAVFSRGLPACCRPWKFVVARASGPASRLCLCLAWSA